MTEQTIAELTNFFQQFKVGGDKTPTQSNLSFDDARDYFFRNMVERGLADATMKFYKNKLGAFRKFLVQIKKVQTLELVTEEEIKYYFNSKYSKKKTGYYNCHARALRAFVKVNIKMHKKLKIKMYNFFTQFVWVQLILNLF